MAFRKALRDAIVFRACLRGSMKFVEGRPGVGCLNHSFGGECNTNTMYSGATSAGNVNSSTEGGLELGEGKGISVAAPSNFTG